MKLKNFVTLLCSLVVLASCARTTTIRKHSDFDHLSRARYKSILLMRCSPEVYMVEFGGKTKRMAGYEHHLQGMIREVVARTLREKGFEIQRIETSDLEDEKFRVSLLNLYDRYDEMQKRLYSSVEIPESAAFAIDESLSEPARIVGSTKNVDLIAFVGYSCSVHSSGKIMGDVLAAMFVPSIMRTNSGESSDRAIMSLALVDAATGKLLWSNATVHDKGNFGNSNNKAKADKADRKRLQKMMKDIIKPLYQNSKKR